MEKQNRKTETAPSEDSDDVEIKMEHVDITVTEEDIVEPEEATATPTSAENSRVPLHIMMNHQNYNLWTSKATACLINQYKNHRHLVGQSSKFRSLRDMFETISVNMQAQGFYFSPQKCENKWRVLERKYKNLVVREIMKKPGRIKHYGHWEHKRDLDEIFNENNKMVYLKESEYPAVTNSTKYSIILPEAATKTASSQADNSQKITYNNEVHLSDSLEKTATSTTPAVQLSTESLESLTQVNIQCFKELKDFLLTAEKNQERRHAELMALRQDELDIQKRLLKIKEEKIELKKRKIIAMSNYVKNI